MNHPLVTRHFTLHRIEGSISSIYLVEAPEGCLLIDPGVSCDIHAVRAYMKDELGKELSHVRLIAVTHMHPDHSGGASELRRLHGIPIASHHRTERWYAGLTGNLQYNLDRFMTAGVAERQGKTIGNLRFDRLMKPDYPLFGQESLPFFTDWKALFVPGHTGHDLVFYHEREKLLFAGDMVVCVRNNSFDLPMPIVFKKRIRDSYEKLARLEIEIICPAHGAPFRPENASLLFEELKAMTENPLSKLSKQVHLLACYSPEVRKACMKECFRQIRLFRR